MRIKAISANNYRTLEDIKLDFAADYCALSGMNNAGKSAIIRVLINILEKQELRPWFADNSRFDYQEDLTQWAKDNPDIELVCTLCLSRDDDPALISFIEKQAELTLSAQEITLSLIVSMNQDSQKEVRAVIDGIDASEEAAKEILRKLRDSNPLFLHNSTTHHELFYGRGRAKALFEVVLSGDEQKKVAEAERSVQRKVKQLAKEHKDELNGLLGKLREQYDVEFSTLEGYSTGRMPLSINLKDKHVEVPLNDWGSGTQNRTYILMSLLQANRIKTRKTHADKITPIVVVEEPESFLHPSAQAEFGKILQGLSEELGIQIIVSTHSPYMLNQANPSANMLLRRKISRKKLQATELVDTSGDNWMEPFAEHLGLMPPEFASWRSIFAEHKSQVLLVEGETDKAYFEHLRSTYSEKFGIPEEVEIVPYDGKDALRNTMLVKFVLGRFDAAFITFDLDAKKEIEKCLTRIGLEENKSYAAIGVNKPGRDAIEGLLPEREISAVIAGETDLVMQLGSTKSDERKSAKNALKKKYLAEFKQHEDYTDEELKALFKVGKLIGKSFV